MAIQLHESFAIHPGPFLFEEVIKPYGMSITATAEHLGVSRPPLSRVLNGRAALSAKLALRVERAFGIPAATLLRMQARYDLARAKDNDETVDIKRLPEPA